MTTTPEQRRERASDDLNAERKNFSDALVLLDVAYALIQKTVGLEYHHPEARAAQVALHSTIRHMHVVVDYPTSENFKPDSQFITNLTEGKK
jgi:hypothetical protein